MSHISVFFFLCAYCSITRAAPSSGGGTSTCPDGDKDPRWGIAWTTTTAGNRDSQPCPAVNGAQSVGFANRRCDSDGDWEEQVDVSNCGSAAFAEVESNAVRDAVSRNYKHACCNFWGFTVPLTSWTAPPLITPLLSAISYTPSIIASPHNISLP